MSVRDIFFRETRGASGDVDVCVMLLFDVLVKLFSVCLMLMLCEIKLLVLYELLVCV